MPGFEDFARRYGRDLLRFACTVTADPNLAEDVVQTVLMRLMADWDRLAAVASPEAYARRAVVNEYLSWRRKWARLVPTAHVPDRVGSRDLAEDHASRSELAARIAALPARQRAVIVLRYYAGCSDTEIAATLGCREVTVRGYLSRALKTLRIDVADDRGASERTNHAH